MDVDRDAAICRGLEDRPERLVIEVLVVRGRKDHRPNQPSSPTQRSSPPRPPLGRASGASRRQRVAPARSQRRSRARRWRRAPAARRARPAEPGCREWEMERTCASSPVSSMRSRRPSTSSSRCCSTCPQLRAMTVISSPALTSASRSSGVSACSSSPTTFNGAVR